MEEIEWQINKYVVTLIMCVKEKNICKKDFLFEIVDLILNKDDKDVNVLENSNKVRVFEDSDDTYSIELLKNINRKVIPNNYMFFRLGRKKKLKVP